MKKISGVLAACIIAFSGFTFPVAYNDEIITSGTQISRISENGISLIKEFEGFLQYAKWDYKQWTIGYGTGVQKDEYPDGITEAEADKLLRDVVVTYEMYVQNFLNKYNIKVNQNQYDALVSFTYNLGNVWVSTDTVTIRNYLIDGIEKYTDEQITAAFMLWCKAGGEVLPGLLRRREAEARLFLSKGDFTLDFFTGEQWRITSNTGVRLRKEPDTSSDILSVIPYNQTVNVSQKYHKEGFLWGKVSYAGIDGWCVLDYAEHIRGEISTTIVPDDDNFEKWRITSDNGVNLRLNYGTSSAVVGVVPYNKVITVYEKKESDGYTWARTEYMGIDGWCVLNYAVRIEEQQNSEELVGIRIQKYPHKLTYIAGELFNGDGMEVVAVYSDGTEKKVDDYGCTGNITLPGAGIITVEYRDFKCDFSVLVNPAIGDINLNGIIDFEDNYIVKKYLLDNSKDVTASKLGDINGDGVLNVFDSIRIKRKILN